MLVLVQACFFALPLLAGALLSLAVIKLRPGAAWAQVPLDGGRRIRGRRVFGDDQTLGRALLLPAATAFTAWACSFLALGSAVAICVEQRDRPIWWGRLLGAGTVLGELFAAFFYRQCDSTPAAQGAGRVVLWVLHRVGGLLGVVLLCAVGGVPLPCAIAAVSAAVALGAHPVMAWLGVVPGAKTRID